MNLCTGKILVFLLVVQITSGQKKCDSDGDCSEKAPCCSSSGFCGSGKGYCTDKDGDGGGSGDSNIRKTGSGCTIDDVEYVGGDLSPLEGGGGINLKKDNQKECYNKCEDNFRCKWFTYDTKEELCYLKGSRGYARNRTDGFVSGSTERNGCEKDRPCEFPFSYQSYQCLYYCEEEQDPGISIADIRRNYNNSKEFCEKYGGFLPYQFQGYTGARHADSWHWLGYPGESGNCWAARPRYWGQEGIRSFPCHENLNFGCEQNNTRYAIPIPVIPQAGYYPQERGQGFLQAPVQVNPRRRGIGLRRLLRRRLLQRRLLGSYYYY